jgi:membrane AbrB-like protein
MVALIARLWIHVTGSPAPTVWFPELHWLALGETLALICLGVILGPRSRVPAGIVLLPMVIGAVLHVGGLIHIELPPWLLAVSFLLLGWSIGLRFSRSILLHAARALPRILLSIAALIAFCGLLACLLVWSAGVDPLTAYLATSPGGIDSAAIIAASTKVDMPFVMSQQMVRLVFVLVLGPPLSRWVAGKVKLT